MAREGVCRRLGKLTALGWLLLAHGPELEADFQQFYGVELGACTPRRAWVLANQLPREARVTRALTDAAEWSTTDHLLATLVDLQQVSNWMFAAANRDPKTKAPNKPEPLPRPGVEKKPPPSGGSAIAALLGRR